MGCRQGQRDEVGAAGDANRRKRGVPASVAELAGDVHAPAEGPLTGDDAATVVDPDRDRREAGRRTRRQDGRGAAVGAGGRRNEGGQCVTLHE